jgi:hypothetical protein
MLNLISILGLVALVASISVVTIGASQLISEDSVLWTCYLMGNHQCGEARHIAGFLIGK